MTRAALTALALALLSAGPAIAQTATGGPITSPEARENTIGSVRNGAASCAGCDLFQADLSYSDISRRDFSGSRLRQADLELVTADRARFRGANLSIANLFGGRFSSADFTNANLERAVLVGAYLGGARFSGAVLTDANLSGAEMADAVGLTQAQLNGACGDATTTLPAGLTVPNC
jgi:uncharacterized protein YjbI with pentapeptide repeats